MIKSFPHFKQMDQMDCGATCLRIILKFYGKNTSIYTIRKLCQTTNSGVNLLGISEAAEKLEFRSHGVRLSLEKLKEIELPCILHWKQNHFVVLYKIKKNRYYISDPASGLVNYSEDDFIKNYFSLKNDQNGLLLVLSPTPNFYTSKDVDSPSSLNWSTTLSYFLKYRKLFFQLVLGMAFGTVLQLITPFLTQSIVDIGITSKNIGFINMILIGQVMLFIGSTGVGFIRSWILLHISSRVNISILTDLLIKLMKLPMSFFELKTHGDIMQRMSDQRRLEGFLTSDTLNTVFSVVNLLVFSFILWIYNSTIFTIFICSTILYTLWIVLFLKYRKALDYQQFQASSENQTYMVEMIQSIRDIKLNNAQKQKRWHWENLQAKLFKLKVKSLSLSQYQTGGASAINQLKGILITYISVKAVIHNDISLGEMMAIQYIVGMASSPVTSLLGFVQSYQDAKISLERLNEIYDSEEEVVQSKDYITTLPENRTIEIRNLTFRYFGAGNEPVFSNLNLVFPAGKTTAIVGASGSGKTTIFKLLLRFYNYEQGEIFVGDKKLEDIDFSLWRDSCGAVLQDSFLYADTLENNIVMNEEFPNEANIENAIHLSNLREFVDEEPFGLKTKLGAAGKGISQGQWQRLMIARAIYKNPAYIFLDEATNSLDANNEKIIIKNLEQFFDNRTVIIIAHRLSTVRNADHIIVLDKGNVVEQGNHDTLSNNRGAYYELVKNQLEMEK